MSDDDRQLRETLRKARAAIESAPAPFAAVWAAAERRALRRQRQRYAGLLSAAAAAVIAVGLLIPGDDSYQISIDVDEIMRSTSWSAPSDALLPEHQFDLYQEVPLLFESTESDGGTLL